MRYSVAVAATFLMVVCGCGTSHSPSSAASRPMSSASKPVKTQGGVRWGVPVRATGWQLAMADQGGQSELVSGSTGCRVTFKQNLGATKAKAQGATPQSTLTSLRQTVASRGVAVLPGPDLKLAFGSSDQKSVLDFPTLTFSARSTGGTRVVVMADRWFGDVELFAEAECPATGAALNAMLDLFEKTTVNQ